ncbi:cytochrome c1 heme lyase CYT2 NDAI_0C00320 [Naumovozyma dairenensis CBS 421]|uniref:Holocytochrome c-type synthase n=1 Tax=Naumovozyma dairenensis (strain ATCC 10597 / BCRC 20456 / CBS 421 / NBRC 0211 / NRRL Y-12639) TaxID=1071378 RepID=G0W7D2_NAUDC|nr:hypothetical protein NDAI_0C00320 [Naumovozyma dairenensis CBS 421]CCD23693.1 hypothetical protein NDAI_0C00320 [Naumovozyma dairenensis CBS 421]
MSSNNNEQPKCPVDEKTRELWLQQHQQQQPQKNTLAKVSTTLECSPDNLKQDLQNPPVVGSTSTTPSSSTITDERTVSSIPRTGTDSNWIYPSEKQFFEAMKRKNWNPNETDMKTVVPLHNSINERVWNYINQWEHSTPCNDIKLTNFKGDSKKLTPRAWFRSTILHYSKPFDRHDWQIDRCGKKIDYVIDFYCDEIETRDKKMKRYLIFIWMYDLN